MSSTASHTSYNPVNKIIDDNVHIPVLLEKVKEYILPQSNEKIDNQSTFRIFDGTLGGGGYTMSFCNYAKDHNFNICVDSCDLDPKAISQVKDRLKVENFNLSNIEVNLHHGNFAHIIKSFEDNSLDSIVLDLGFSSNQLDSSQKGFSYLQSDDILDLRYDDSNDKILPLFRRLQYSKDIKALGKILYNYSGEKLSMRIADRIVENIENKVPIMYVKDLVNIIMQAIPIGEKRGRYSILSRIWQSLRIWVNDEFISLERFLPLAVAKLKPDGGRLAIVCFHSLEDKIVTKFMRTISKPVEEDEYGNKAYDYYFLTSKSQKAEIEEVTSNNRSRSATLRVLEKKITSNSKS
jgi:16S rRNA (cytosine1402-N4)-methyltransferase